VGGWFGVVARLVVVSSFCFYIIFVVRADFDLAKSKKQIRVS